MYGCFLQCSRERFRIPLRSSATREKISSAACPTPGCKGIGHVKGAKYSTHHSTFGCPYSLQNLNKESCLVDRLSSNSMTEESDWSYASKQKLAVVKSIKGMNFLICLSVKLERNGKPHVGLRPCHALASN